MNYLENLSWRYATKRMLPNATIQPRGIENILEAIRLAPSSYGLTPYSVCVVQGRKLKQKMQPVCMNQPQITECHTLLVFMAWKTIESNQIRSYIHDVATIRDKDIQALNTFKTMLENVAKQKQENNTLLQWSAKQCYIALGFGLVACSLENVDSTPMEGFQPDKVNQVLGIDKDKMEASVMLAIGKRDEANDTLAKQKKVRKAHDNLFIRM